MFNNLKNKTTIVCTNNWANECCVTPTSVAQDVLFDPYRITIGLQPRIK